MENIPFGFSLTFELPDKDYLTTRVSCGIYLHIGYTSTGRTYYRQDLPTGTE